jgi:hypothetical protein
MVTNVPTVPLDGLKEVMTGGGKVNPASTAVPPGVVTLTFPEAPRAETTAVMLVAETTLKEVAAAPPKLTAVALVKFVPVKVTVAPLAAVVGVNEVMVGAGGT